MRLKKKVHHMLVQCKNIPCSILSIMYDNHYYENKVLQNIMNNKIYE